MEGEIVQSFRNQCIVPVQQLEYWLDTFLHAQAIAKNKSCRSIGEQNTRDTELRKVDTISSSIELIPDVRGTEFTRKAKDSGRTASDCGSMSKLGSSMHNRKTSSTPNTMQKSTIDRIRQVELSIDKKIISRVALVGTCDGDSVCDVAWYSAPVFYCLATSLHRHPYAD